MTKKIIELWAKDPPKRRPESLDDIVADWKYRFSNGGANNAMRDHVTDYCAKAPNVKEAVYRACASRDESGKMHNHQSRVKEYDRTRFANAIIFTLKQHTAPKDFDQLFDLCKLSLVVGIGPVTLYDVATRIAAWYGFEVESLYLHAGVRAGWQTLTGRRYPDDHRIPRSDLPAILRTLPTDEVEDMLCCYRDHLKPWLKEEKVNG